MRLEELTSAALPHPSHPGARSERQRAQPWRRSLPSARPWPSPRGHPRPLALNPFPPPTPSTAPGRGDVIWPTRTLPLVGRPLQWTRIVSARAALWSGWDGPYPPPHRVPFLQTTSVILVVRGVSRADVGYLILARLSGVCVARRGSDPSRRLSIGVVSCAPPVPGIGRAVYSPVAHRPVPVVPDLCLGGVS